MEKLMIFGEKDDGRVRIEAERHKCFSRILEDVGGQKLWIGEDHLLNRGEAEEVMDAIKFWLENGRLPKE